MHLVSLQELDKFIGSIVVCGLIRGRHFQVKSLWGTPWVCLMFSQIISRDRFHEISLLQLKNVEIKASLA